MLKKILLVMLVLSLLFSILACNGTETPPSWTQVQTGLTKVISNWNIDIASGTTTDSYDTTAGYIAYRWAVASELEAVAQFVVQEVTQEMIKKAIDSVFPAAFVTELLRGQIVEWAYNQGVDYLFKGSEFRADNIALTVGQVNALIQNRLILPAIAAPVDDLPGDLLFNEHILVGYNKESRHVSVLVVAEWNGETSPRAWQAEYEVDSNGQPRYANQSLVRIDLASIPHPTETPTPITTLTPTPTLTTTQTPMSTQTVAPTTLPTPTAAPTTTPMATATPSAGGAGGGGGGFPTATQTPVPIPTPTPTATIPNDWYESLVWMRQNTPDPFQNPNFLNDYPPCTIPGQDYNYPESAYWIMSWSDYGCWIIDTAKRLPNTMLPDKGARDAALFFTAQDEMSANNVLNSLASKFVIIDSDMTMVSGKFGTMITSAQKDQSQFYEKYYIEYPSGTFSAVMIYYPEYYQSICSRLYIFGAKQWVPNQITVISWTQEEVTDYGGNKLQAKVITDQKSFATFDSAEAFVQANPGYIIVGTNPLVSPVPLASLEHYQLIHKSPSTVMTQGGETISSVEIFEYSP